MADSRMVANMRRFVEAINAHDRENPTHTTLGLLLSNFDMERLGIDEGEEVIPGVPINGSDKVATGNFRIVCDGQHDNDKAEIAKEEITEAVGMEA